MAVAPLNKFLTIAVPVAPGEQTIYTAPTGTSAILLYAQVSNVGIGQSYPTVTFTHRRTSVATRTAGNVRNNRIIKDGEVPPNDALILVDGRLVLERTSVVSDSIVLTGIQTGIGTVFDVKYDGSSGVTTVTTLDPHGLDIGEQITMAGIAFTCSGTYGLTTSIFPEPQAAFTITNLIGDVGTSKTFVTNTGLVNALPHVYRPAFHQFVRAQSGAAVATFNNNTNVGYSVTFNSAEYDPISGIVSFTSPMVHGLAAPETYTATTGTGYDPISGIMTTNTTVAPSGGWQTGDLVCFEDNSISFSCDYESGGTKSYPRSTDPISSRFVPITRVDDDTFEINVGPANNSNHHTYQSAVPNGIKRARSRVGLGTEKTTWKCSQDNYLTEHKYPRATDPSNWGSASDELGVDIVDAVGTSKTFSVYAGVSTSGGLVGPLQMEFICSILENSTAS